MLQTLHACSCAPLAGYASHAILVRTAPQLQGGLDNLLLADVNAAGVTEAVREASNALGKAAAIDLLEKLCVHGLAWAELHDRC